MGKSNIDLDRQMYTMIFGKDGQAWLNNLSHKDKEETLQNIYKSNFDSIVHYFYRNGISLEDMVKVIHNKAHRHNGEDDAELYELLKYSLNNKERILKEIEEQRKIRV